MKIANTLVSSSLRISTAIFSVSVLGMHTAITLRYKPYQRSTVAPSKFTAISRVSAKIFHFKFIKYIICSSSLAPINIFNSEQSQAGYPPLRLSYQRGSHYNAILDPYNATVGVGLGLAGYKPEFQTKEAVRLSEQLEIEQVSNNKSLSAREFNYVKFYADNVRG